MDKKNLILLIVLGIFILGFLIGAIISQVEICTQKGCSCQNGKKEVPCNKCSIVDYTYATGIFNVAKMCPAQEVIMCENNQNVGRKYDINDRCEYKFSILFFPIN